MFENLGFKLRTLRMDHDLSRQQVSELVGVTASMIGLYETSDRLPSLPVLVKLATLYKVSVDYLFDTEIKNSNVLSLEGLTFNQIKTLQDVGNCYRRLN